MSAPRKYFSAEELRAAKRERQRRWYETHYQHRAGNVVSGNRPSEAQQAERDARYAAAQKRSQTQAFFGDPPFGYSALERKQQQERP